MNTLLVAVVLVLACTAPVLAKVVVGVDLLKASNYKALKGTTLAALTNPTSLLNDLTHVVDDLAVHQPDEMKLILGPEHGFRGNLQAETGDPPFYIDEYTGLPVVSAYNLSIDQLVEYLRQYKINALLVDLQDVGVRLYTYIWTMYKVMTALSTLGKQDGFSPKLIITDRPNPNGGVLVDGPMLNMSFASGYARVPIPFVHGMTIGELASYFNTFMDPPFTDLEVIRMENWNRNMLFYETGLSWMPPSPNLPTVFSALAYAATVFIEGTTISEGRGTTTPFTIFGAPFLSAHSLADALNKALNCPVGRSCFRAAYYQPTFQKYNNTMIEGVQLLERNDWKLTGKYPLRDFRSTVDMLKTLKAQSNPPESFVWDGSWFGHPGTELVDQYAGTDQMRIQIDAGVPTDDIVKYFAPEREKFIAEVRAKFLLY